MSETDTKELNNSEKQIFEAISNNDVTFLTTALSEKPNVNVLDENLMTPLQHAAYKGNKEMVQLLLDHGADVNLCKHQHNYTALHFAGLSGNVEICQNLLLLGAKPLEVNTVNRTPAQMAAFVGNHNCVTAINNFVPKSDVDYYTTSQGTQSKPHLPPFLAESFHKFILQIDIHPVKIALNTQNFVGLSDHLEEVKNVLELMRDKEMKRGTENNEFLSFKFHYLSYIIGEIIKIHQRQLNNSKKDDAASKLDATELFARKVLKPSKDGSLEIMDQLIRESIREYPFRECTLFRQVVSSLAVDDPPSALSVNRSAINGQRGFVDNVPVCNTCGEEKPAKKCSKCKVVQYCDRNCQRLHWHWHKKMCQRLELGVACSSENKPNVDADELSSELQNLLSNQPEWS